MVVGRLKGCPLIRHDAPSSVEKDAARVLPLDAGPTFIGTVPMGVRRTRRLVSGSGGTTDGVAQVVDPK